MFDSTECLCKYVGRLVLRGNVVDSNFGIVNIMANCIVPYVDMFRMSVFRRILRDVKDGLTVSEERNRSSC